MSERISNRKGGDSMNNPTPRGARSPDQRLPKVKWFTLVFGFALLFLGYKTMSYSDPRLPLELSQAIETLSRLFFALGGLSVLVTIAAFCGARRS